MEVMKWYRFFFKSVSYVLKEMVFTLFDYVDISVFVKRAIKKKDDIEIIKCDVCRQG